MSENQSGPIILIIEDDPSLAKMYSTKFISEGFRAMVAHDGAEGLAMAANSPQPSAILLDMMLPKYSGIEVLEQIKERSIAQGAPIVVLSNKTEKGEKEKAIKLGAKEYLAKAMHTPEEVVNTVRKYLQPPINQTQGNNEPAHK